MTQETPEKRELERALENDTNASIVENDLTHAKIMKRKNKVLQKLPLTSDELKEIHEKLTGYRYLDKLEDFVIGNYVRWIKLVDIHGEVVPNFTLTYGAFICDFKIYDPDESLGESEPKVHLMCKTRRGGLFQIDFDRNMIFQKLNRQENIILSVLNYLNDK
jgi:hypothetical protein